MKKIIVLSLSFYFAIGVAFSQTNGDMYAQSIIGKWNIDLGNAKSKNMKITAVADYSPSGALTMNATFVATVKEGVSLIVDYFISGKYELFGKALCREFNDELKTSWKVDCPSCDSKQLQQLQQMFAPNMDDLIKEMGKDVKLLAASGMYQQILQLNEDVLVIGRPGGKAPEVSHRE